MKYKEIIDIIIIAGITEIIFILNGLKGVAIWLISVLFVRLLSELLNNK